MNESKDISYEVVKHLGVLDTTQNGWTKEANIIRWNGGEPKLDIRDWNPEHNRMNKGITLKGPQARKLAELLYEEFRGKP